MVAAYHLHCCSRTLPSVLLATNIFIIWCAVAEICKMLFYEKIYQFFYVLVRWYQVVRGRLSPAKVRQKLWTFSRRATGETVFWSISFHTFDCEVHDFHENKRGEVLIMWKYQNRTRCPTSPYQFTSGLAHRQVGKIIADPVLSDSWFVIPWFLILIPCLKLDFEPL